MKTKPDKLGYFWRVRTNGNAIGGFFLEYGVWHDRPLGPTQRPREFFIRRQKHFHSKAAAVAEFNYEKAKIETSPAHPLNT